jgi:hypothetical protein
MEERFDRRTGAENLRDYTKLPSDIIELKARWQRQGGVRRGHGGPSGVVLCSAMASFLSSILLPLAVGAVALVLLLGLLNMMRGGNPNRSQKLMQLRVLLQFVAIVITMLTVWALGR